MQAISPKKPKPGPAMPQSSSVTASVITAIDEMTTSATMSSMRATPARSEVAASAPSALKASTNGQRAPGAMPVGRNMKTKAAISATTVAVPKKWRVMT